jgi:hypothetical protein
MESQDLKRWEFHRELISMAASCVGLKPNTAKKKAAAIFNKYSPIISSSESMEDYYKNQWNETYNKYETLKSGRIKYIKGDTEGKLLLKDIEQIEVRKTDVLLITKTGREISMGLDFKYLKDLF